MEKIKEIKQSIKKNKSQTEVDQYVIDFLGDMSIKNSDDLIVLRDKIQNTLENRPYNDETREHADSIQWRRTASEIIKDGYVYDGKSCSDLSLVFLTVCRAAGIEGHLVKLVNTDNNETHSIVEVKLSDDWYRFDPSVPKAEPRQGQLSDANIKNKQWKVWARGKDLWELGLVGINDEEKVYE